MNPQVAILETNYPQILDGFCYSGLFGTRPLNGLNWYWEMLQDEEMQNLRLAADSYRPRHWVVPKNFTDPANVNDANIAPGKTVFYEFQVKEGSWLWGVQFAVAANTITQDKFSIVIRQGTDLPFLDRPSCGAAIYEGNPVDPFNTLKPPVNLLKRPRLIIPPTQLHVEISNDSDPADPDNSVSVQLVILFAEPK